MYRHYVVGLTLTLILAVAPLSAQTTAGSIVGTVTDPSGAIVAGATVTITNMGTNIAVKTTSDSSGEYVVTPLEVGKYAVAVEATGFKRSIRPDIQVNVQDRVRVDAKLEVGKATETVEVRDAAVAQPCEQAGRLVAELPVRHAAAVAGQAGLRRVRAVLEPGAGWLAPRRGIGVAMEEPVAAGPGRDVLLQHQACLAVLRGPPGRTQVRRRPDDLRAELP